MSSPDSATEDGGGDDEQGSSASATPIPLGASPYPLAVSSGPADLRSTDAGGEGTVNADVNVLSGFEVTLKDWKG